MAYSLPQPIRLKRPAARSADAASHWHATRILVALLYLAYCLTQAYMNMPTNLYSELSLGPYASEHELKQQYRHFARIYHPDKTGHEHEGRFLRLQSAYAILSDPLQRFAYDRFGPDAVTWRNLSSMREFLVQGLGVLLATHFQLFAMQMLAWLTRGANSRSAGAGTHWGILLQLVLFLFQMDLILKGSSSGWLNYLHGWTVYEVVSLTVQNFAPFLLVMEHCATSLLRLFDSGSRSHFQFGTTKTSSMPSVAPNRELNSEIASLLQEEATTLHQAQRQIQLMAGAVLQLERKVLQDCSVVIKTDGLSHTQQAPEIDTKSQSPNAQAET
ncbi:hypothetical protein MPSI1_001960 [Malassezia psittaci]|uniref:J domain-containing protein n=1 Tax=Malassezia psittaci TaxID=1821823 RepID=A0AAF0FAE5_9BASI|nr:hypothetical protein MPSI1_001960 [Malassezia psittaci]